MPPARRLPFTLTSVVLSLTGYFFATAEEARPLNQDFLEDWLPDCGEWAERGDCQQDGRPFFMQKNCPESCYEIMKKEAGFQLLTDDEQQEFFELSAKEANGNVLQIGDFEGYVTVVVNAARMCDRYDIFWEIFESMVLMNPYTLEILAFPFDHPDGNIDSCRDIILSDEKKGRKKIHIMEAVEINGPGTHPLYSYLKGLFGIEELDTKASHYFFVSPDVSAIDHHYGAGYRLLKTIVDMQVPEALPGGQASEVRDSGGRASGGRGLRVTERGP